jgi:hypothetical protein
MSDLPWSSILVPAVMVLLSFYLWRELRKY